jgi:hypothetical protein
MWQWNPSIGQPEVVVNANFDTLSALATYGKNAATTSGLTWGYYGGRWGGNLIADGTLTLTNATQYIVVNRSNGVISLSTSTTNWNDFANYGRVHKVIASGGLVTSEEDHRVGLYGVHGQPDASGTDTSSVIAVAVGDETSALTAGTNKVTFRIPYNFLMTVIPRASLTSAQASGSIFTVDINKNGTSILSTKLTIDNTEKTSKTAATPCVLSSTTFADDDEVTIDIDQVGTGAAGLKVYIVGKKTA